ncbi:MAG: response regulator [Alphaproteobacteria bacterium]|jgi:two-component system phosphate regulon response regulator OmpR
MDKRPHILVVDDDTRLRDLLTTFLKENGFRVTAAGDAGDAREKLESLDFDLLVLDVMMPGETGLELTRSLRQSSNVPILMLTALGETDDRIHGIETGADDYLPKPFEPRELVVRLNAILRRSMRPLPGGDRVRFGPYEFDLSRGELRDSAASIYLTTAELAMMTALVRRANAALSREELAAAAGMAGNPRSVDVQITRLRRKIEDDPKTPVYLQTVRGRGYVLRADTT